MKQATDALENSEIPWDIGLPVPEDLPDSAANRKSRAERDRLVLQYLPLARNMARKTALPREDAEQEAILGLMHAAERYDERAGTAFPTYAYYWITDYLQRASVREYVVHVPLGVAKAQHAENRRAERAKARGEDYQPQRKVLKNHWSSNGNAQANVRPVRIVSENEDGENLLESMHGKWVDYDTEIDHEKIQRHIKNLPYKQKVAINLYYGPTSMTLEEIGAILGISREAVRQNIERGLTNIREEMDICVS
ncbi:sigma-70 family RNA polymerase sigma factor [Acidithiobacillus caldus]